MTDASNILGSQDISFPADLHVDTPEKQDLYRAALEFERVFVTHMLKDMDRATKAGSDSEDGSDSATASYTDMARDQMAQSVLDGGGLGLAAVLYTDMTGPASSSSTGTTPASTGSETPDTGEAAA